MVKDKFRHFINGLGVSPETFANKIGVGKSGIYKILRGDVQKISVSLAKKINQIYPQYTVEYVLSLNNVSTDELVFKGETKIEVQKIVDIITDNIEKFEKNKDFQLILKKNTIASFEKFKDFLDKN